jgi:hypothetical protein
VTGSGSIAGTGVTLVTVGANDITLAGSVNGSTGNVTLTSGQAISTSGSGTVTTAASGNIGMTAATNETIGAAVTAGGAGTIGLTATSGALAVNAAVSSTSGNITATAGTAITESGSLATSGLLSTTSSSGTTLNGANTVGSFHASNSGSGDIALTNTATTLTVTGVSETPAGNITLANTGDLTNSGVISTNGGNIAITTTGAQVINAAVTTSGAGTVGLSGVGITNNKTITGTGGVTINAGTGTNGTLVNNTATSIITNGGGAAAINLLADQVTLDNGTITGGSGAVSIKANSAGQAINLGSGTGGFDLNQAELNSVSTTGGLTVGGSSTHTALLTVGSLTSPAGVHGGGFTVTNGGDVALTGSVAYNATAGNSLNITSVNGNITGNGSELLDTTTAAGGNIVLTAFNNIGSAAHRIHIGSMLNSGVVGSNGLALNSTDPVHGGNIFINKAGALNIAGIQDGVFTPPPPNAANLHPLGSVDIVSTGNISQSGPVIVDTLTAKTLNNAGASIVLLNPGNDVINLNLLSRNAADTANSTGQLSFFDPNGYTVGNAAGGGINFSSTGPIQLASLAIGASPATLNLDAGNGDITLQTTGAITVNGPGKLLARNINLSLSNNVTFQGGIVDNGQNDDLLIQATNDININAHQFTVKGGNVTGVSGQNITHDVIINAGGTMNITTTLQANPPGPPGSPVTYVPNSADFTIMGGNVDLTGTHNASASGSAFLNANVINLDIGGKFLIQGGTVTHGGAGITDTGNASAVIRANTGKSLKVADDMQIIGGTMDAGGDKKSTAIAVFDPFNPLSITVGKNLIIQGGTGPADSLVSASILNSGEIKMDVGQALTPGSTVTIGAHTYPGGIILVGGKGSGRFDFNNNPLTENGYPISWTLAKGAEFTIDTTGGTTVGDAFIQSLAPRGVDTSLYGYLLFAIDRESTGKSKRSSTDQGNFKAEAGSCN